MAASSNACGAGRAPTTTSDGIPFTLVDTLPKFFAFWSKAEGKSIAEQAMLFRNDVVAAYPSLYAPNVIGLGQGDPTQALDERLSKWLPSLPRRVPQMRATHRSFVANLRTGVRDFRRVLPDFRWSGTCALFPSLDAMNGALREVDGQPALLFGLDVVANDPADNLPVLFAHELFHAHHISVQEMGASSPLYQALWREGLASFVSMLVVPGTSEEQALPASHLHDPARPVFESPDRSISLAKTMPRYARELGEELRKRLDSERGDDYAMYFLGRAAPSLAGRPVRSGYWFGLEIARRLARNRSPSELARAPLTSLHDDIARALDDVIQRAPG